MVEIARKHAVVSTEMGISNEIIEKKFPKDYFLVKPFLSLKYLFPLLRSNIRVFSVTKQASGPNLSLNIIDKCVILSHSTNTYTIFPQAQL